MLIAHPERFADLEHTIDQYFRNAAGRIAATVLFMASKHESTNERIDDVRTNAGTPLRNPVKQSVTLRLLCGIVLIVTTLYCAPARTKNSRDDHVVTEERRGLYPELALYGFAKKSSAALENKVSRAAVLYPSFEIARQELAADGIVLDVKEVRRVTLQCGEGLLALRCEKVKRYFEGTLEPGDALYHNQLKFLKCASVYPTGKRTPAKHCGGFFNRLGYIRQGRCGRTGRRSHATP